MRLNQVEPIRPSDFRWAPLSERHIVTLSDDEAPLTLGTCPVEHHPLKDTQVVPLGLNERQTVRLGRTTIKGKGVVVLDALHDSSLESCSTQS